ncbi:Clavaminate synthase-like protein [Westerdykella ornata]|uniref:Clavaminate synthase-like protein n=1 Tax=Westerdykella ornata TaxID=318751 RepID=A0A6A6J7X2_WESOR|nr:Clavaminate synthase-like protein [Westerdykella ornata]KAF2272098.1 Clavaminate synthase-like protein [Westerdykella ornata]
MPLRLRARTATSAWRRLHSTQSRTFLPIAEHADSKAQSFDPLRPAIFRNRFGDIPAISKWFTPHSSESGFHELNASYLEPYGSTLVPLELTRLHTTAREDARISSFERLQTPLSLLISHITSSYDPSTRLYLAQCPLEDLPAELQKDLPMPDLVSQIGKGDVYGSSLWMGKPPTMTPLHRDPNPNLFVQLAGKKIVRMMKSNAGRDLYMRVRAGSGHANMRGEEMMVGDENARLETAVWGKEGRAEGIQGWEAELQSGDGLYVPLGWWHSVRGVGSGVNGSVNWWFR